MKKSRLVEIQRGMARVHNPVYMGMRYRGYDFQPPASAEVVLRGEIKQLQKRFRRVEQDIRSNPARWPMARQEKVLGDLVDDLHEKHAALDQLDQ